MIKTWRAEYKRLWLEDRKRRMPVLVQDFPNDQPTIPSEKKANGLTQLIIKYLTWSGHYANRIGVQGQARVQKTPFRFNIFTQKMVYTDKTTWTKGQTKRGTPDIHAIIYGKAVWIEVKVGKDRMSADQLEQKAKIEEAGGLYFIAQDMQSFVDWYKKITEDV